MSDPKPSVREQYDQAMARGEGNVFLTRLEQADREREYAYLAKAQAERDAVSAPSVAASAIEAEQAKREDAALAEYEYLKTQNPMAAAAYLLAAETAIVNARRRARSK